ncbi:ninjurin-2 isoform X1 [Hemicordylus capensis]|uniref:ninjurin-2 isoform X1 n=1 Tax=Hemicordylus capensis TaxID=884348 RepID=UPI002303BC8F|nr:ninjurin-2 isoform X1 [Hemicordylus capensis]
MGSEREMINLNDGTKTVTNLEPGLDQGTDSLETQHPGFSISPQPLSPGSRRENTININHYATKKSVAESMLDVALFMANATQLKAVLEQGPSFQYYATLIALISVSLFFQTAIGILLIVVARMNLNDVTKQQRLDMLNNVATALIFITVIVNIFITAFGVQKTGILYGRRLY